MVSHIATNQGLPCLVEMEYIQGGMVVMSNNTRGDSTHGHHRMGNTEIRLIIFTAAKDREALYSQQKEDLELIVALIISFS